MAETYATVEKTQERNDANQVQDCVYVACEDSGHVTGPVWGHSDKSVRRALAQLTSECSCGASFHLAEED